MIQKITLLICVVLMFSCGKDEVEPINFLTQGKWVLKSEKLPFNTETTALKKETLQFNTDGTFVNESFLKSVILPYAVADSTPVRLTGKWTVNDYAVMYINENLSIPMSNGQDSIVNTIKSVIPGKTISSLYGYRYGYKYSTDDIYNDTIKVMIGNESYLGKKNIVIPDTIVGFIIELTENKLVVESENIKQTYYKE